MFIFLLACVSNPKDSQALDSVTDSEADSDTDTDTDTDTDQGDHYFPAGAPWYQDIRDLSPDSTSNTVIGFLQDHGWGNNNTFQIDFSIDVLAADASTPLMEFQTTSDFYSPDCDHVPMPIPDGGHVESESGYACSGNGDCHLLIAEREGMKLYEMWRANIQGSNFRGGCLAVWDMTQVYPESGRGDQCSSADAAGYPIAPLLFTADELAAGEVDHAIRFILPNDAIRDGVFFHPATHATNAEGGGNSTVPYGAHLRLKADFDMSRLPNDATKTLARALQTYGMFLADGGNIALTGQSDQESSHKYADLDFDSHSMYGIEPQDFEMMPLGTEKALTFDCVRNP
jgi:serine/threonine-protein kinase